jgi:hypothetical protein
MIRPPAADIAGLISVMPLTPVTRFVSWTGSPPATGIR